MKTIKSKLAVAALLSLSGLGIANADTIATAQLDITNFKWTVGGTALSTDPTALYSVAISPAGTNDGSIAVNLNGVSDGYVISSSIITEGGQIPFKSFNVGDAGPLPPITGTYAYGAHELTGAVIDIPTFAITAGATATYLAEASLIDNGVARSETSLGANTAFDFTFTGGDEGDIVTTTLSLDYFAKVFASVIPEFGTEDDARAGISWNLTVRDITDGGNTLVENWFPGQLNLVCAVGAGEGDCLEEQAGVDDLSLNVDLVSGRSYRFAITSNVQAIGDRQVPEPTLLSLLGFGLVGFGLQKRRKAKLLA